MEGSRKNPDMPEDGGYKWCKSMCSGGRRGSQAQLPETTVISERPRCRISPFGSPSSFFTAMSTVRRTCHAGPTKEEMLAEAARRVATFDEELQAQSPGGGGRAREVEGFVVGRRGWRGSTLGMLIVSQDLEDVADCSQRC